MQFLIKGEFQMAKKNKSLTNLETIENKSIVEKPMSQSKSDNHESKVKKFAKYETSKVDVVSE